MTEGKRDSAEGEVGDDKGGVRLPQVLTTGGGVLEW